MDVSGEMKPGRVFARDFRVERLLALGGMGAVYVVEQLSTGKRRALKVLYPQFVSDDAGRRRFAQEARIGAELDSDHVVEVVGAGIDDSTSTPWLAMELLEGQDLATHVQSRERLDAAAVGAVLEQLCDALARAHAKGVVHRDLKPENIFIATARRRGVPFTLKILDFGIAKIVQENRAAATGSMTIGSPLWMAPEQAVTAAPISARTDVWSLGLIATWLFAGDWYWANAPRGAAFNLPALLVEVMTAPLDPASAHAQTAGVAGTLPRGFDGWFARCVNRDPAGRFADAGAAFEALAGMLSGGAASHETILLSAPPTPPTGTMPMPSGSIPPQAIAYAPMTEAPSAPSRAPWILAALGALTVIGGAGLFAVVSWRRSDASIASPAPAPAPTPIPATPAATPPPAPAAMPAPLHPASDPPRAAARAESLSSPPSNSGGEIVRERVIRGNTNIGNVDATGGEGEIDAGRVASLIRGQMGGIRSCYVRALPNNPTLAGRIDVRFTIGESGRVTSINASGLSEAPEVGNCASSAIRRLSFPQPTGGSVDFTFPLTFSPSS